MLNLKPVNRILSILCQIIAVSWTSDAYTSMQEIDPNSKYTCKGPLGEFPACACNEMDLEISCINAQFVDTDVFKNVPTYYKGISKITFHGNNFQDLPDDPLFGENVVLDGLTVLNISANYIVNLNSKALRGLPNIRILDLSNNEIVLRPEDVYFLSHTPKITHLYLRRAFTSLVNRTIQFDLMVRMFYNGKLHNLQYIDLSFNYLTSVPYNLPCPFPALTKIDFRQNLLQSLAMNTSCLQGIESIDLSRNHFNDLDKNFRDNFANSVPANSLLMRNSFHCDCNSADYIQWIRSTNAVCHSFFPLKEQSTREKVAIICIYSESP
uniref:Uncharacterized protein n=1 Tax=Acrobeloides nanus TaxID=290746 RepID=A0A914E6F8_9BILA